MQTRLDRLRDDAAECAMLAIETADKRLSEILFKLSAHLTLLSDGPPDTFFGRRVHKRRAE